MNNVGPRVRKSLLISGSLLILLGLLANEWSLTALLSRDGVLQLQTRILIWVIDLILITVGILLIMKREFFWAIIKELKDMPYSNDQSWFTLSIILFVSGCILMTTYNPYGQDTRTKDLLGNPFLLSGKMATVHKDLLAGLDKRTKVLAAEETWIRSFANVDLDNVFHALFLPPFEDSSGETDNFLNSLDVIWVSHNFSKRQPSLATQEYLRYYLHVGPFLEKAVEKGWTVQEVAGFGKIYRRPISG